MITTVLFDVDGTLIDTEFVIVEAFRRSLAEVAGVDVAAEDLDFILGIPGAVAIERYVDKEADRMTVHRRWDEWCRQMSDRAVLYDGIDDTLRSLQQSGYHLGVVTSRTQTEMRGDFERLHIGHYFDVVVTASDTARHKPEPDPILHALERFGVPYDQAIYVGDTVYDWAAAQAARVRFGLATWGAKNIGRFTDIDVTLDHPSDLLPYVTQATA